MYEVAIVGDLHLAPRAASRTDNYFESLLDKVREIANNCKNVIFLGDVFEHETIPLDYFQRLYNELQYLIHTNGNKFYSIIGNHDIYNYNETTLPRTALGLCHLTNTITVIMPEDSLVINGHSNNYTFRTSYIKPSKCKEQLQNTQYNEDDILLLHQDFEEYDGLTYEDLKSLGCKRIFFGHEHRPMESGKQVFNEFTAYRCGSCGRSKADGYQLNRHIFYYILQDNEVKLCTVDCMKPGSQVFTEDAYNQVNLKKTQFIRNIQEVVDKYSNNISVQNKFSINTVLQELNTPDKCFQYIRNIYQKVGEKFE